MPKPTMPERQPMTERVVGALTRLDGHVLLSPTPLPAGELLAQGPLILRYGIAYLGKAQLCLVPDLIVADYGALLTGDEAWEFLMRRGHLFPRADVFGWRSDDDEDMARLKQLDLDHPYAVFAYRREEDARPFAEVSALIAAGPEAFPPRLQKQLPAYANLRDWQGAPP